MIGIERRCTESGLGTGRYQCPQRSCWNEQPEIDSCHGHAFTTQCPLLRISGNVTRQPIKAISLRFGRSYLLEIEICSQNNSMRSISNVSIASTSKLSRPSPTMPIVTIPSNHYHAMHLILSWCTQRENQNGGISGSPPLHALRLAFFSWLVVKALGSAALLPKVALISACHLINHFSNPKRNASPVCRL